MKDDDKFFMLRAMHIYGGGFVSALATAWSAADSLNSARLAAAFPDLVASYGPGSMFFAEVKKQYGAEEDRKVAEREERRYWARSDAVESEGGEA